jgi:hypothetical protein
MEDKEERQPNIYRRKRRVPRLKLHFPVRIEVITREGQPHQIDGRTIEVSRYGATLECDEPVSIKVAVSLTLPFGGPYMAQVNGVWIEEDTGRFQLSTKLLDPPEWTAQNKTFIPDDSQDDVDQITLEPRTYHLLSAYKEYLQEGRDEEQAMEQIAHALIKKGAKADTQFQKWMTQKIMEDLQSWEDESVHSDKE